MRLRVLYLSLNPAQLKHEINRKIAQPKATFSFGPASAYAIALADKKAGYKYYTPLQRAYP